MIRVVAAAVLATFALTAGSAYRDLFWPQSRTQGFRL
jgi:hypothetical protein